MNKQPAENRKPSKPAPDEDSLHVFLMADDTIRGVFLDGSRMIVQMRQKHELGILETLVLGHGYIGACLMSSVLKGKDRLRLQVECSGPIKGLVVEANAAGEVRGFLKNVPIPVGKPLESFNLVPFFGAGFLSVTRILADAKQPFTGRVMMAHGTLAKDLAHYYLVSEQIPTSFSLSVKFDVQGNVAAAGGLFLQAMPDADETVIHQLEDRVVALPSIGEALAGGTVAEDLVRDHFMDFSPRFIDRREVGFVCHCSRNQIRNLLALLPPDELKALQANGPFPVEIRCHHCNARYTFNRHQIDRIVALRFSKN